MGSEARLPVEAIKTYATDHNLVVIAHELTEFTKEQLTNRTLDAVISQDAGHLVRSCVRRLTAINQGTTPILSQEQVRIENTDKRKHPISIILTAQINVDLRSTRNVSIGRKSNYF